MNLYGRIYAYVHGSVSMYICTYAGIVHIYVCMHMCMYAGIVHTYVCMQVHTCMNVCMYIYMYIDEKVCTLVMM